MGALAGHSVAAVQAAAAQAAMAAQVAALEQLRDKLEAGEPPEKKMALPAEEHHRLLQRALQHNLLAMTAQLPMNIRINNQGTRKLVEKTHNTAAWTVVQILRQHCVIPGDFGTLHLSLQSFLDPEILIKCSKLFTNDTHA